MSRVKRKESPKTNPRIPRKSNLNFENLKPRQIEGVEHTKLRIAFLSSLDTTVDPIVEL